MKTWTVSGLACLLMMNSGLALAWSDVSGTIKNMNIKDHEITLDNGTTYTLETKVNELIFKVGDKVTITTETANGKNWVTKAVKNG